MNNLTIGAIKAAFLFAIFAVTASAQATKPPDWFRAHMNFMTQGTGKWVADNAAYKSENEPFEAYVTEWQYGVGRMSIVGRLYGIRDGKPTRDFWQYFVLWDSIKKEVHFYQTGAGGALGNGVMTDAAAKDPAERSTEMTLLRPDGISLKDKHRLFELANSHKTISYLYEDGKWTEQRTYIWKLEK